LFQKTSLQRYEHTRTPHFWAAEREYEAVSAFNDFQNGIDIKNKKKKTEDLM
jgi:hypothetical protein